MYIRIYILFRFVLKEGLGVGLRRGEWADIRIEKMREKELQAETQK